MIELRHVTKRFGSITAVTDLNFTAPQGEIIGLLGQNGAGKTTTLNMLTGYFPPTEGQVLINGMDMLNHPRECKRLIGYLPEKPPLYDEMTVCEYLKFVCRLREVREKMIGGHIADNMKICGLADVKDRLIGSLSKGYRQRVGVAQALCGDPPLLVLDEPTVGLDPKQVVEIRDLIREVGQTHTVIFSSHILSEIQQLCSRALILHHGRLAREMKLDELGQDSDVLRFRADIAQSRERLFPALSSLACVQRVKHISALGGREQCEIECRIRRQDDDEP